MILAGSILHSFAILFFAWQVTFLVKSFINNCAYSCHKPI